MNCIKCKTPVPDVPGLYVKGKGPYCMKHFRKECSKMRKSKKRRLKWL